MKFFGPDASLVALDNHTIILTDLSLSYTVEPTQYCGHTRKIIDIQIFLRDYFVSLDESGVCFIWSLKNTPNERRRSSGNQARVGARQNRMENLGLTNINNGVRCQQVNLRDATDRIVCLYLIHRDLPNEVCMYVACKGGRVIMYEWHQQQSKFIDSLVHFNTRMPHIRTMICTMEYFIVLNKEGKISFFDLKNSAEVIPRVQLETYQHPLNVFDLDVSNSGSNKYVVVVYHDKIMQIKYTKYGQRLHHEITELYSTIDEQNVISCSAVSDDLKYLILGTAKGIIVFDPIRKTEELRSSVSDNITSLDICSLDSDIYKYILISGSTCDVPVINISGLDFERDVMQWATDRMGSPINESNLCSHQRLATWLLGGKWFHVNDMNASEIELNAIDSRGDIHKRTSNTRFLQSEFVHTAIDSSITVMSAVDHKYYFGYSNGFVFEYDNPQPFITLGSSVEYLKCFTSNLIVAATKTNFKIRNGQDELEEKYSSLVVSSFQMDDDHLILVKEDCSFQVSMGEWGAKGRWI